MEQHKIRCLVIDDEPLARMLIEKHLSTQMDFVLSGTCKNTMQAETLLETNEIDLIFLDINLPKISGIEWVKKSQILPKIIITTAHPEYAVEGFDLDVVDYIVKPVTAERFSKALNKYKSLINKQNDTTEQTSIAIKSNGILQRIPVRDIVFAEAVQKYVRIYTVSGVFETLMPLSQLEKTVNNNLFFRCHKSYLVQLDKISGIKGYTIFAGSYKVPVSRGLKAELTDLMNKK
ncbi:MAG: response regulator transcription factor [Bacteroidetes bacterium]|nr:response regulator transcription factor [Bacteroidota bacterium]